MTERVQLRVRRGKRRVACAECGGARDDEVPASRLWGERHGKGVPLCGVCKQTPAAPSMRQAGFRDAVRGVSL